VPLPRSIVENIFDPRVFTALAGITGRDLQTWMGCNDHYSGSVELDCVNMSICRPNTASWKFTRDEHYETQHVGGVTRHVYRYCWQRQTTSSWVHSDVNSIQVLFIQLYSFWFRTMKNDQARCNETTPDDRIDVLSLVVNIYQNAPNCTLWKNSRDHRSWPPPVRFVTNNKPLIH